jgi:hypothetical protein
MGRFRGWLGWVGLLAVALGLYQLGYTGVEWEAIKASGP